MFLHRNHLSQALVLHAALDMPLPSHEMGVGLVIHIVTVKVSAGGPGRCVYHSDGGKDGTEGCLGFNEEDTCDIQAFKKLCCTTYGEVLIMFLMLQVRQIFIASVILLIFTIYPSHSFDISHSTGIKGMNHKNFSEILSEGRNLDVYAIIVLSDRDGEYEYLSQMGEIDKIGAEEYGFIIVIGGDYHMKLGDSYSGYSVSAVESEAILGISSFKIQIYTSDGSMILDSNEVVRSEVIMNLIAHYKCTGNYSGIISEYQKKILCK